MIRTISSLLIAATLAMTLAASFVWIEHATVQAQEAEPSTALGLDVTIETAQGDVITLPLQIDAETLAVLMEQAPAAAVMDTVAQLVGQEVQTITIVAPAVFTPVTSMLLIEPIELPSPPLPVTGTAAITEAAPAITATEATPLEITVPPATEAPPPRITSVANLRAGPTTDAEILGQIDANTQITITGRNSDGSWYRLEDGSWVAGFLVENAPDVLPVIVEGNITILETIPATVTGTAVVLRAGPSLNDQSLGALEGGTVTAVLSRAPDGEWLEVLAPDGTTGWMSADFLEVGESPAGLPAVISSDRAAITGGVVDGEGEGIGGIVVAATHTGGQAVPRVDATTASDGSFTLYMSPGGATNWTVEIAGVGCDSRIVNDRCQLFGYFAAVPEVDVTLPAEEPVTLVYEDATSFIAGTVVDSNDNPVGDGIAVGAEREDGARTAGLTSSTGKFVLPAGPGVWTVSTESGPTIEVEVPERSAPEPVDLQLE